MFSAHPFVPSMPRVPILAVHTLAALLALQALAPALHGPCIAGATPTSATAVTDNSSRIGAREGQQLFHSAHRHPQKKEVASLHLAERNAAAVDFPCPPSGRLGVSLAGGVRGSAAGSHLDEPTDMCGRPGATSPSAAMAVSAARNLECHRV